jgi:hypothetical protein
MATASTKSAASSKGNGAAPPGIIDDAALVGGPDMEGRTAFPDLEAALGLEDEGITVAELLLTVARRKPKPTEFFRVHPDPTMSRAAYVFIDREEMNSECYFVMPAARPFIAEHLRPVMLVSCITRQNVAFIWPVALPDPGANSGRQNRWGSSALEAMEVAKTSWVKMTAGQGFYRVFVAENLELPEPQWPERTFGELLNVAFKNAVIEDQTHPVVKRLRGRV